MQYVRQHALKLLRMGSGIANATFREGQEEAIRFIVEKTGRLLVVQKTGWGKSFVYFIATKLLRNAGAGPALLVSPLLSLMRNQIAAAERMNVRAATINSDNAEMWSSVEALIARNEVDILLISPERFANERFQQQVLSLIADRISLLVIDEAHCISDWGHDFRPHYRLIERIIRRLPPNMRLLATTATANNRVMKDLDSVLGPGLAISRGELNRPSLTLQSISLPAREQRLAWLAEQVPKMRGSGIVYTLTIQDAQRVGEWLKSRGISAEVYTSRSGENREKLENALLDNRIKVLVATTALGMGYDKPDLSFVIHYQTPGSVVAYYQQVGRAGRALDEAYGVLLSGEEEQGITNWFIRTAFPTRKEVELVLDALEAAPEGLSLYQLLAAVNLSKARVEKTVELLSLESPAPIANDNKRWQLTTARLSPAFWERTERLTALRQAENQQMQEYVRLPFGQHMPFLIAALDGDPAEATPPRLPPLPRETDPYLVRQALEFLNRKHFPFEPRLNWPSLGLPQYGLRGKIPPAYQAQPGKILCAWGDSGWGKLVREGKYRDNHFSDSLVEACAKMVGEWNPSPKPTWVTCIPSLRHPTLVPDFARRLAAALGLPFSEALIKTAERPEQKTMENSIQQARNVDGSLEVDVGQVHSGPVILVDDMVDSKWTMTVAAWLLQRNGSGKVWPMALSFAGRD